MLDMVDVVKGALDFADRIIEMRSARQARAVVDELRAAHDREGIDGLAEIERIRASAGLGPAPDLLGVRRPTQGRWSPAESPWETPPADREAADEPDATDEELGDREHVESAPRGVAKFIEAELVDVPGDEISPTDGATIIDATIVEATKAVEAAAVEAAAVEAAAVEAAAVEAAAVEAAPTADVEPPPTASEAPDWVLVETAGTDVDDAANDPAADDDAERGEVEAATAEPESEAEEAVPVVALVRLAPPPPAAPPPPRPHQELRDALMEAEAARGRPAEARRLYERVLHTAARPTARFPETLYAALALQGTSECDADLGDLDAAMANSGDAFAWAQRAHAEHPSEETLQVLALAAQAHAQISERASDRPQFIEVVTGCLAVIEPALQRRECLAARQIQIGLRSRLLTMTRPKTYIRKGAVTPASLTLTTLQGVRR